MKSEDWRFEHPALVGLLQERLGNSSVCIEVIDGFDEVFRSIWTFTARLLGEAGTRAVLNRALQLAVRDTPMLQSVRVNEREVDLGNLRARAADPDCEMAEMFAAILGLAVKTFDTLADLTGDVMTGPLLNHLGRTGTSET